MTEEQKIILCTSMIILLIIDFVCSVLEVNEHIKQLISITFIVLTASIVFGRLLPLMWPLPAMTAMMIISEVLEAKDEHKNN